MTHRSPLQATRPTGRPRRVAPAGRPARPDRPARRRPRRGAPAAAAPIALAIVLAACGGRRVLEPTIPSPAVPTAVATAFPTVAPTSTPTVDEPAGPTLTEATALELGRQFFTAAAGPDAVWQDAVARPVSPTAARDLGLRVPMRQATELWIVAFRTDRELTTDQPIAGPDATAPPPAVDAAGLRVGYFLFGVRGTLRGPQVEPIQTGVRTEDDPWTLEDLAELPRGPAGGDEAGDASDATAEPTAAPEG